VAGRPALAGGRRVLCHMQRCLYPQAPMLAVARHVIRQCFPTLGHCAAVRWLLCTHGTYQGDAACGSSHRRSLVGWPNPPPLGKGTCQHCRRSAETPNTCSPVRKGPVPRQPMHCPADRPCCQSHLCSVDSNTAAGA
jgi:hypothetical protein